MSSKPTDITPVPNRHRRIIVGLFLLGLGLCSLAVAPLAYTFLDQFNCAPVGDIETVIPEDADVTITLERTLCFGECPVYKLVLEDDGTVHYEGLQYVRLEGKHMGQISEADFQQLVRAFEEINFYRLKEEYEQARKPACGADPFDTHSHSPSAVTSLTVNSQTVRISHIYGNPRKLHELEQLIDELTQSDQWIHSDEWVR